MTPSISCPEHGIISVDAKWSDTAVCPVCDTYVEWYEEPIHDEYENDDDDENQQEVDARVTDIEFKQYRARCPYCDSENYVYTDDDWAPDDTCRHYSHYNDYGTDVQLVFDRDG